MRDNSWLLLAVAALTLLGVAPIHAQTSSGTLTWYLYVSEGPWAGGELVIQTSNALSTSAIYQGPLYGEPLVRGYPIESVTGSIWFAPNFTEPAGALLSPGPNVEQGCEGGFNQEENVIWMCTTANLMVDDLIVPNAKGRGAGLDGAGIGFAANWVNNNPQPGAVAQFDDFIQLYTQSGQSYLLSLARGGAADPVGITISSPEPDTLVLTGLGLAGIWLTRRNRRKRATSAY
jgi:hypothetical protein